MKHSGPAVGQSLPGKRRAPDACRFLRVLARGFAVAGFWTTFFASIFIIAAFVAAGATDYTIQMPHGGMWL